jgi:hypothetical protein
VGASATSDALTAGGELFGWAVAVAVDDDALATADAVARGAQAPRANSAISHAVPIHLEPPLCDCLLTMPPLEITTLRWPVSAATGAESTGSRGARKL